MPVFAPQSGSGFGGFGVERQRDLGHLEILRKIYSGSKAEVDAALKDIPEVNPQIKKVSKSGGNLAIEYNPVLDKDGNVVSQRAPQVVAIPREGLELFATQSGRALIPGLNIESAYLDWQQSPYRVRPQGYSAAEGVSSTVFSPSKDFIRLKDADAAISIKQQLPDGFTVEPAASWNPDNKITITAPDNSTVTIETNESDSEAIDKEYAKLINFVQNKNISEGGGTTSVNTSKYNQPSN
jgi:hypothetical protein